MRKSILRGVVVLTFSRDERGDAVVEAAILFPIMIMIFAALVLLAAYLPTRAALQQATQYAATAIATQTSDTWLFYDESSMSYYWETDKKQLDNVYVSLFRGIFGTQPKGEDIVIAAESRSISSTAGKLSVDCSIVNRIVYKEVVVTAGRTFTPPVGLSFIGFPETITITVTSTAVVQNGDEFIRNIDLAVYFVNYIFEEFGLTDVKDSITSFFGKVSSVLGL
jgi:hypothetical protein